MESKPRFDGKGELFGNMHRYGLPSNYCMFDIDRMRAVITSEIAIHREEEAYVEYMHKDEDIVFTALIEVKYKFMSAALDSSMSVNRARIKMANMLQCPLFVVFKNNGKQPLTFYEINTRTGESKEVYTLTWTNENLKEKVEACWQSLGLYRP
jgi:hypothetical protein